MQGREPIGSDREKIQDNFGGGTITLSLEPNWKKRECKDILYYSISVANINMIPAHPPFCRILYICYLHISYTLIALRYSVYKVRS